MTKQFNFWKLNLQLFAEGAGEGGGTGAEGATSVTGVNAVSQTKGSKTNPLANVVYGKQEEAQNANVQEETTETESVKVDRNAEFEKLIKGEYKDLYDTRMQETIQKRLKGTKEITEKYNALSPIVDLLSKKYGVDPSDIAALNKAIEDDDTYYEDEAIERGLTVEQLKQVKKMERENAELKKQMAEKENKDRADQLYSRWMEQEKAAKSVYPSLDLRAEMQNPKFIDLLRANVDVRTAYEVLHKDEIIPAAMQFTAKQVEQKIANKIMANGSRPIENGISSQSGTVVKSDVSQLSKEDRMEIIRRVQRGEKIRF